MTKELSRLLYAPSYFSHVQYVSMNLKEIRMTLFIDTGFPTLAAGRMNRIIALHDSLFQRTTKHCSD